MTTVVIEMSQAAGITLVPKEKRNPLCTTTFGVGELIKDAVFSGCSHVFGSQKGADFDLIHQMDGWHQRYAKIVSKLKKTLRLKIWRQQLSKCFVC